MNMQQNNIPDWMKTIPPDTKTAVIIPLYGYWSDLEIEQLNAPVLQAVLSGIKSATSKLYFIFVGEDKRIPMDIKNILAGMAAGGNVIARDLDPFSTYVDYIQEGMTSALEDTDAQFIVVVNPWVFLKTDAVDTMIYRLSKPDISIASAYDLRTHVVNGEMGIPAEQLYTYEFNPARELRAFCSDFWGTTRQFAQMLPIDIEYRTHYFVDRDLWQTSFQRGLEVISSQFIPIYSFDVDFSKVEFEDDFLQDQKRFMDKWKFDPSIKY